MSAGRGTAPESSQAIRRFAAIAHNVTRREEYFPEGVSVDVIHHPSNLRDFKKGKADYLFTVSRLDNAKRVSLLIDAMKLVRSPVELRIAGTGRDNRNSAPGSILSPLAYLLFVY